MLAIALFLASVLPGCSQSSPEAPPVTLAPPVILSQGTLPIMLASSADFGRVRSGSAPVSRIVEIRNSSKSIIHVSRWTISCDCLSVEPASIDVEPMQATCIRLVVDPAKEGEGFVGDLRISVEGFADVERICTFDVPVAVIASDDVKHLDGLRKQ